MKRQFKINYGQLVGTILSHPQAPELVSLAAREAVAEAVDRLQQRQARREAVQAVIVRDDQS